MAKAYIGLGSNMADPMAQLSRALTAIKQLPHTAIHHTSAFYRTAPVGKTDQPDFVNAAIEIDTSLSAIGLLRKLQTIELQQGRERKEHWGPRTLDLDLLVYGNQTWCSQTLTIPHPRITQRQFVLRPLCDINPQLMIDGDAVITHLECCPDQGVIAITQGDNLLSAVAKPTPIMTTTRKSRQHV